MLDLLAIASHDYAVYSDLSQLVVNNPVDLQGKRYGIIFNQNMIVSLLSVCCLQALMRNGILEQEELINSSQLRFKVLPFCEPFGSIENLDCEVIVLVNEQGYPTGVISNVESIVDCVKYFNFQESEARKTLMEYEAIFESLEEEIFVTDQQGIILRLNPASERVFGLKKQDLIGKHVSELVKRNIISASTTEAVLEQKCRVNMMQDMMISGKKVIGTAIPILDEVGQLVRVVSTSKDIDQINRLKSELDKKKTELGLRDQELDLLRSEIFSRVKFVYASDAMNSIKDRILRIADTDLSVLIHGESGVGKEVIAKAIHYASKRKNKPFVKINCGLIPENLLESELFGYERGAFTGADKNGKIGKVELANGGTLFLDEIGEMPLMLQVKLLEFLQDKTICRVGGTRSIPIETRVLAATNCNLQDMVTEKLFRQDLYYRLNIMTIKIPALRERKEDIDILVEFFKQRINKKYGIAKRISPELKKALYDYDWPGNVRELEHVVERLMVVSDSDVVSLDNIEDQLEIKSKEQKASLPQIVPLKAAKAKVEEELVRVAYAKCHSTYKAAEMLEVDQSTIVKLIKKYKIKERLSHLSLGS
ncbi:sigma-54 interaction domain-containing protein [Sporomusa sp.]|uniref:sigma-54 interaction domain-containing protein n=1 Tax=Sporomusa sp. TaxID=2078658 RepID=UPI002C1E8B7A|nr:sigma 54-interacting transcriptional regulator [Sporomusa sp.]HWR45853.1 sigma 54-interacting transcriptional regulator [Sporomusa sp.]